MKKLQLRLFLSIVTILSCLLCSAQGTLQSMEWNVDGMRRTALVYVPSHLPRKAPLVFVFHGRRGRSAAMARKTPIHTLWQKAIVVYPQGEWCKGGKVGDGAGWIGPRRNDEGRDIHFFDAMLATMRKKFPIDNRRIYAVGQSNGSGFVYGLWRVRGDIFAALVPMNGAPQRTVTAIAQMRPLPAFIVGGKRDTIVTFDRTERMVASLYMKNECTKTTVDDGFHKEYSSPTGATLATYLHDGGHATPAEVVPLIVDFLKSHRRKK